MLAQALAFSPLPVHTRRPAFSVICAANRRPDSVALPGVTLRHLIQIRLDDQQARETYIRSWWPVIEAETRRYASRGGPEEELLAEGALALWEAALQYATGPRRRHTSTTISTAVSAGRIEIRPVSTGPWWYRWS